MNIPYSSFGSLLAKVLALCVENKSANGKYAKVTYDELQEFINKSWIPESVTQQEIYKTELFNDKVLDPVIDLCRSFLTGLGLVDEVSSSRSIRANLLTEQYGKQNEIIYSSLRILPLYSDYLLFRLSDCVFQAYDAKTKRIGNDILREEREFNDYIYGAKGDSFINNFISDVLARLEYNRRYSDTVYKPILQNNEIFNQDLFPPEFPLVEDDSIEEIIIVPEVDRLENRVLARIKSLSPTQFEKFSLRLMAEIANADSSDRIEDLIKHHGSTGDGGIDGVVRVTNKFDHEYYYVQCKRYTDKTVGRPQVQEFVGAMEGRAPKSGMFITTSSFTKQA